MSPTAIICLGNRFAPGDDLGSRVYDHLAGMALPADVALVDGGLCGLDLLHVIEGRRRVVFADAITGLAPIDEIVVLSQADVAAYAESYGHGAGLPYLLHMLPQVCSSPLPEIAVVGTECPDEAVSSVNPAMVRAVAERCVELAAHGLT